jgi:hypothetical protein
MDSLIDNLSHDMYLGKSLYVGINELPFWIQRFIAQQKKNKGHAPIIWTMGESTTCEIEDRIEVYFKSQFPNIEVIAFEANADIARELNQEFIEHGEYIDSKKKQIQDSYFILRHHHLQFYISLINARINK